MRVLITGATGQDGSALAEQLAPHHDVYGMVRGQRNPKRDWLQRLVPSLRILDGDLLDQSSLQHALTVAKPDVVYNLGAITYVGMSWQQPSLMSEVTGLGCLRMLEAIRAVNPAIRFVQASSSEQFGQVTESPQTETTPFNPRSPYGVAKVFAHHMTVNYRDSYGMHASCAIMFNHESERRGEEFVTRKICAGAARIARGETTVLRLGNLGARRDWGWGPDFMRALPLIAAKDEPGDYVLATGETHSVVELCAAAFRHVGLDWRKHVEVDPDLFRPADVNLLLGDASKAAQILGWEPTVRFDQIVKRLIDAEQRVLV
jgi:GDPmannose 4,6-dehydratase